MNRFQYRELLDEEQIRIIELLPGAKDDVIQCSLSSELRQGTENTYDAISYVWGDDNMTEDIICDKKTLSIKVNLASAIRTIRNKAPHGSKRLWADAICINQTATTEKSHQVKRMGQVYGNARRVYAWLGPDEDGDALNCFNLIQESNQYLDKEFEPYTHPRQMQFNNPPNLVGNDSATRRSIRSLMARPWFSRVWVIQEAALAKECYLLWGDHSMSIAEFMELACFCDGRAEVTRLIGGDDQYLVFWGIVFKCVFRTYNETVSWQSSKPLIKSIYGTYAKQDRGLFLDILQVGRSLSASNPVDHIYAFLGNPLAISKEGRQMLVPDYAESRTLAEVYFDFAVAALENRHESPYLLGFVQHKSLKAVTQGGPSWIPQWSKSDPETGLFYNIGNIGVWHKAGGSPDMLHYQIHGNSRTGRLTIRGFIFDRLTWVSGLLKRKNFALNREQWDVKYRTARQPHICTLWESVPAAQKRQDLFKTFEFDRHLDEFSYTIVTGYNKPRTEKVKNHRKIFRAYVKSLQMECDLAPPEASSQSAMYASRYDVNTFNCENRQLAVTRGDHYALVPPYAQEGDVCCILFGMVTPYILRPAATPDYAGQCYHLVGEAYIHNVMRGERMAETDNGPIESVEITLI
jgi:Heterokaryon incompatibility protein (HET)